MEVSHDGFLCHPSCPIRLMGEQSGTMTPSYRKGVRKARAHSMFFGEDSQLEEGAGYQDSGTAARFFKTFGGEHVTEDDFCPDSREQTPQNGNHTSQNSSKDDGRRVRHNGARYQEDNLNLFTRTDTRAEVLEGDCLSVLKTMENESISAVVTDPPAGISFMNAEWDSNKGSRNHWIAWLTEVMEEVLRVTKPGGHALVWALPRTSHWTAMALEDAGWEVRDRITHHFGSGFPKSASISKHIDRMAGAEREVVGTSQYAKRGAISAEGSNDGWKRPSHKEHTERVETAPATDAARQWDGYGTALKPSTEDWWLCRKPLSESSIARNVLEHGTGGLNIDGTRISHDEPEKLTKRTVGKFSGAAYAKDDYSVNMNGGDRASAAPTGRFPANLLLSHSADCVRVGEKRVKGTNISYDRGNKQDKRISQVPSTQEGITGNHCDPDGKERVAAYECAEDCPCKALDEQSGVLKSNSGTAFKRNADKNRHSYGAFNGKDAEGYYGDSGGASRFFAQFHEPDTGWGAFYCPKSSRAERNRGLEGMEEKQAQEYGHRISVDERPGRKQGPVTRRPASNSHPTVKSVKLMRYLVRLVTPPGGTCLDPFAGSGSTLVAAIHEGFDCIGIEAEPEYAEIARRRTQHALENPEL